MKEYQSIGVRQLLVATSSSHMNRLDEAWKRFIYNNDLDARHLRPIIARSWQRCRCSGVDPFVPSGIVLSAAELKEKLEKNSALVAVAAPFMKVLLKTLGHRFIILLTDSDACVLEVFGKPEVLAEVNKKRIGKGAILGESVVGSTAMGLAILEKRPIQVVGKEHYCAMFHGWTCSAAPIFDPSGQLLGVLDVSGPQEKVHPHTLGIVIAAAKAIENHLRLQRVHQELVEMHEYAKTVMSSISEGLIAIDENSRVTWINTVGANLLGTSVQDAVGRPLQEIEPELLFMVDVMHNPEGDYFDKEIRIKNNKGHSHFTATARPIIVNRQTIGVVAILREFKSVHRLVTNYSGARARFTFNDLIGESQPFQRARFLAYRAARSDSTVLLVGETGTGKELFAHAIHNESRRADGPFVAVNCAALPRELIASELFGYEEGAFTGARRGGCPGKFELAHGGTIFLDEIGDMPLEAQVALLRVLQDKQVVRLGGHRVIPVDVRVIAATHHDLEEQVRMGRFRQDLFYRLNIISIRIPPLRERQGDICLLARYFVKRTARHLGKEVEGIDQEAMQLLTTYCRPGNVRELENVLESAISVSCSRVLRTEDLPERLKKVPFKSPTDNLAASESLSLQEMERQTILATLKRFNGNIARSARALGIARNTLYYKMRRLGINH